MPTELNADLLSALSKIGGPGALVICSYLALKYGWEWLKGRNAQAEADQKVKVETDAASSAGLRESLRDERAENGRLRQENEDLRDDNDHLRDELFRVKSDYEAQIAALRRQLNQITRQLDSLQASLQAKRGAIGTDVPTEHVTLT